MRDILGESWGGGGVVLCSGFKAVESQIEEWANEVGFSMGIMVRHDK